MSQRAHTKYEWPPYATEWNPPHESFLRTPLLGGEGTLACKDKSTHAKSRPKLLAQVSYQYNNE